MAAKTEGVVHDGVHGHFARGVRDVIQIALGVGILQIDGRRDDAVFDGQRARGHFHRARRAKHVAGRAFGGTDGKFFGVFTENRFDRLRFRNVADGRGSAVGIDVIHIFEIQAAGAERHFHAARRAFAAR